MAGDLLQKLNISAQQQVRLQKPAQNQPVAAAPVQTPIKEKGLEYLPAVTITPAKTIPTGLKPQSPAGRLISENVFKVRAARLKITQIAQNTSTTQLLKAKEQIIP